MKEKMYQSLLKINERYQNLVKLSELEATINNISKYRQVQREINSIKDIVDTFSLYLEIEKNIEDAKAILNHETDSEIIAFAKSEIQTSLNKLTALYEELKILLLPKDENDDFNAIIEIRGAAGGDEANLFAGDLFDIYRKWCLSKNFKIKVLERQYGLNNGFSLVAFSVIGEKVFANLKYESGVHRVQRIPITETQGRVHTSTVTVTVMPDISEEINVEINPQDLKIDTMRSSGAGGQSVNTTDSAVRITHLPTGLVVNSQEERSQLANKDIALKVLKTKLYNLERQKKLEKESGFRKLAGSGARSEKIRTYNYPQDRVTDHRISLSVSLKTIASGKLDSIIGSLQAREKEEKIKAVNY